MIFVSYSYMGTYDNTLFGHSVLDTEGITCTEDLLRIEGLIQETYNLRQVVILNWKILS